MVDISYEPVDASKVARFSDIATFMRTRRVDMNSDIDIGLVGVPFDIGQNYRGGSREAPSAIRQASRIIRNVHPTTGIEPYGLCNIADLGDAPVNPLNKDESIAAIEAYFASLRELDIRPIAVGGDHTIPTPILRGLVRHETVGILHIDAHSDTLDEMCGTKINHATFMRRVLEEGLIDPRRVVQLGLRGSRFSADDISYGYEQGFTVITFDDFEEMGRERVVAKVREVLGTGRTYLSIDIDGLDPSYCPGTPVPEIGGLTPRDVQVIIRALANVDLIGADICEVAPCYDPTGITCVTAANLMFEIVCLMAGHIARNRC